MLNSRKISPEKFTSGFLEHLKYGVIPRGDFIAWQKILEKSEKYQKGLEFFGSLGTPEHSKDDLRDALLSSDNPGPLIKCIFELLGHTADSFCLAEDYFSIPEISEEVRKGTSDKANYLAQLFIDLGLDELLSRNADDAFLGVQIGLETHRRKNVGGRAFKELVGNELINIVAQLERKVRTPLTLKSEQNIFYENGVNKKRVDFLLLANEKPKLGFELNFYTVSGSKPTEIKRSYAEVTRQLKKVGVGLIWITDGKGYLDMQRSLKEAFETHPNTYNLWMVRKYLLNDIVEFLNSPS